MVGERGKPSCPDRDSHRAISKCPAVTIINDDGDVRPHRSLQLGSQFRAGLVRVGRKQKGRIVACALLDVRHIDAGISQHEAKLMRDDEHVAAVAHDLRGLGKDQLNKARVFVDLARKISRIGGRFESASAQ